MGFERRARRKVAVAALAAAAVIAAPTVQAVADGDGHGHGHGHEHSSTQVSRAATQGQRNSILRLYRAYFLRNPDRAGLDHWAEQLSSGRMTLNAISEFFARSDEFRKRYGSLTDAEFVRLVYQNVLGRRPDSKGVTHWTDTLRRGMSRGQIMVGFSESVEFQRKTGTLPSGPSEPTPQEWSDQLLTKVNAVRAAHGLHALTTCPPLTNAAGAHSADQARHNNLSHTGSNGSSPGQRVAQAGYHGQTWGENVAMGYTSIDQVVDAWLNSATHRENLLSRAFVHVGFGRSTANNGSLYWTQDFGAGGRC